MNPKDCGSGDPCALENFVANRGERCQGPVITFSGYQVSGEVARRCVHQTQSSVGITDNVKG